jgi:hypothetical protein
MMFDTNVVRYSSIFDEVGQMEAIPHFQIVASRCSTSISTRFYLDHSGCNLKYLDNDLPGCKY